MVVFPTPPFWLERTMVLAISKVTSVYYVVWCGNTSYLAPPFAFGMAILPKARDGARYEVLLIHGDDAAFLCVPSVPGQKERDAGKIGKHRYKEKNRTSITLYYNNKQQGKQLSKFFCKKAKDIQSVYDNIVDRVNTGKGC